VATCVRRSIVTSDLKAKQAEAEGSSNANYHRKAHKSKQQISQRISRYQQHLQTGSSHNNVHASNETENANEDQVCCKKSALTGKLDTTSIAEKLKKSLSSPGRDTAPALMKLSRSVTPTPLLQAATGVVSGRENSSNRNSYENRGILPSKVQMLKNSIENDMTSLNGAAYSSSSMKKSSAANGSRLSLNSDYYSKTPSLKKIANATDSLRDKRKSIASYLNEVLNNRPPQTENAASSSTMAAARRPMSMSSVNLNSQNEAEAADEPEPDYGDYWDMASATTTQAVGSSSCQRHEPMKKAVSLAEVIVQSISSNGAANSKSDAVDQKSRWKGMMKKLFFLEKKRLDIRPILKNKKDKCPKTIEKIFFQDTIRIKPDDEENTYEHVSRLVSQTPPLAPTRTHKQPPQSPATASPPSRSSSSATPSYDYYSNNMLDKPADNKQEVVESTKQQQHSHFLTSLEVEASSVSNENKERNAANNVVASPDKYKISLNISNSLTTTTTTTTTTINNYLPPHSNTQEQIHLPVPLPAPLDFENLPSPAPHFIPPPPPLPPPPAPPLQYQDITASSSTIAICLTNVTKPSSANGGSVNVIKNNIANSSAAAVAATAVLTIDSESLQLAKQKLKAKGPTSSVSSSSSSSSSDTTHLTISTANDGGNSKPANPNHNNSNITTTTLTATFSSSMTTTTSVPGLSNCSNSGGSNNSKKNEFLLQEMQSHRLYNTKKDYVLDYLDRNASHHANNTANSSGSASTSPSSSSTTTTTASSALQSSENGSIDWASNMLAMNRSLSNCNLSKKAATSGNAKQPLDDLASSRETNINQNSVSNSGGNYERFPYVRNRQIMPYTYQKYLPHNNSNNNSSNKSGGANNCGNSSGMHCYTKRAQSNSCLASDRNNSTPASNPTLYEKNPSLSSNPSRQINTLARENRDVYVVAAVAASRCASVDHLNKLGMADVSSSSVASPLKTNYATPNKVVQACLSSNASAQQKEVSFVVKQATSGATTTRPVSLYFDASVLKSELVDGRNPKVNNILQKLNGKPSAPPSCAPETHVEQPSVKTTSEESAYVTFKRFKQLQPPEKMESELDRVFKVSNDALFQI
jgi:hypothetical protein